MESRCRGTPRIHVDSSDLGPEMYKDSVMHRWLVKLSPERRRGRATCPDPHAISAAHAGNSCAVVLPQSHPWAAADPAPGA
jgi:hypothetical protein